jgi:hypothetical protein
LTGTFINADEIATLTAGKLRLGIGSDGKLLQMTNTVDGKNYLLKRVPSYLLSIQEWNGKIDPRKNPLIHPDSASVIKKTSKGTLIKLTYKNKYNLQVLILKKKNYLSMKLVKCEGIDNISEVKWGPYYLTMREKLGKWIGIARSPDFSIGMISTELNTDGEGYDMNFGAIYDMGGTKLVQESYDRSKTRALWSCPAIVSTPVKDVNVLGSSVALFGVTAGRDNELNIIEKIELGEKLPHPMYKGKWAKRSREVQKPLIWTVVNPTTIDSAIKVAKAFGAAGICQFQGFYKNWGHFEPDPRVFPNGMKDVLAVSQKCTEAGIFNSVYTLSSFLKPISQPEPYISPVPDKRLAKLTLKTAISLAEPISKDAKSMKIKLSNGITDDFKSSLQNLTKVFKIDNELIQFNSWKEDGKNTIICENLKRGGWMTIPATHKKGAEGTWMFICGYNNLYPGTLSMSNEVADNIANLALNGKLGKITLDGYESVLRTALGTYARNVYIKRMYDINKGRDLVLTASNFGNWNWHLMSDESWGEFDKDKGFRGTMLEIRLGHQVRLINSLMPNKLGQYYPDEKTTVEDIEWLCNQIAGWDAGVDLCTSEDKMQKNPNYEKVASTFRLWEEARIKNVFTEKQKINLRQTDLIFRLKKDHGKFKLKFVRHWEDGRAKMLPASYIKITPLDGAETVKPRSIKWLWTHNPAIYSRACLTDDMICNSGKTLQWKVKIPNPPDKRAEKALPMRLVIRLAKDAKSGAKNIIISYNNAKLDIAKLELNPGEYFAIPHDNQYGYVYDEKTHFAKRAIFIYKNNPYWFMPTMKKGEEGLLKASCEPIKPDSSTGIIINVQYFDKYRK